MFMRKWLSALPLLILMLTTGTASSQTPAPSPRFTPSTDSFFSETLRIGRGAVLHAEWRPDGERVLVDTIRGAWLYSIQNARLIDDVHLEQARFARFSPDGRLIAGVNEMDSITLWDASTYAFLATLSGHDAYVRSLVWRPNDHLLASLDHTGRILIWDANNGQQIFQFQLDGADQITWSPDGTYLAAADFESGIINAWSIRGDLVFTSIPQYPGQYSPAIVWRTDTQLLQRDFGETPRGILWDIPTGSGTEFSPVGYASAYSPDGSKLAAAGGRGAAVIDAVTGETLFSIDGPQALIVSWSPDGEVVAYGDWRASVADRAQVTIVDSLTGMTRRILEYDFSIKAIVWSPDGEDFLVIDDANQIYLSGSGAAASIAHTEIGVVAAWRSDGRVIAAGDTNYGTRLWDANTGEVLIPRMNSGHPATRLSWQPGGYLLATAVGDVRQSVNNNVYIWDTSTTANSAIDSLNIIPHVNLVAAFAWSPDGSTLASLERAQYIRLWRPDDSGTIHVIDTRAIRLEPAIDYTRRYSLLGWSPNGNLIYVSSSSSGNWGGVRLFDVNAGTFVLGDTPPNFASTWTWTPDNRFIWAKWGQYGNVPPVQDISVGGERITDNEQAPLILTGLTAQVAKGIFSPDASQLIGFDTDNNAIIWDVDTRGRLVELANVYDAVWSPDGLMIAVYGSDGFIRVIDSQSGEILYIFERYWQEPGRSWEDRLQVIWSPDSSRIALLDEGVLFIYNRVN
jgi:WD40 repeat protein